jgi:hypothetical protein
MDLRFEKLVGERPHPINRKRVLLFRCYQYRPKYETVVSRACSHCVLGYQRGSAENIIIEKKHQITACCMDACVDGGCLSAIRLLDDAQVSGAA